MGTGILQKMVSRLRFRVHNFTKFCNILMKQDFVLALRQMGLGHMGDGIFYLKKSTLLFFKRDDI